MGLDIQSLDNDTRGWILCIISGIACVFGASIICVDLVVRLFPGKRDFRIQESNVFLASSLSLSFGVMIFSALYSMLPESREYLEKDGWDDQPAGLIIMACFIGGFFGIQVVSRLLHQHMPSHVVDCDHSHSDSQTAQDDGLSDHGRKSSRVSRARRRLMHPQSSHASHACTAKQDTFSDDDGENLAGENTPLLSSTTGAAPDGSLRLKKPPCVIGDEMAQWPPHAVSTDRPSDPKAITRRPSMYDVQKRLVSFVKDTKSNCDEEGSCYGYTDPCGQECFKHFSTRTSRRLSNGDSRQSSLLRPLQSASRQLSLLRSTTEPARPQPASFHGDGDGHDHDHDHDHVGDENDIVSPSVHKSRAGSREPFLSPFNEESQVAPDNETCHSQASIHHFDAESQQHHHHVPTNAFLSIGLQTSIAIALHKFPEGFITYATNHANPSLGFNVFMALFVHNISEGFAMCLPLYMALGSRWRAIVWSAVLGGLSQPVGAGIAALWFSLAQRSNVTPNAVLYACLFAVTSGIMVSVGLQLFVEGLSLNHNRNLCIFFGFIGMVLLGLSNAFFAEH